MPLAGDYARRAATIASGRPAHARGWMIPALLLCLAVPFLKQYFDTVAAGYRIQKLQARGEALRERNRRLLLETHSLGSLDRLETIARGELGLMDPSPDAVRFIRLPDSPQVRP